MEWISVNDRLPENCVDVLVYDLERYSKFWVAHYMANDGVWYENCCVDIRYQVTHWMPLPEPPKETKNEMPTKILDFTGPLHSGIELIIEDKE